MLDTVTNNCHPGVSKIKTGQTKRNVKEMLDTVTNNCHPVVSKIKTGQIQ